jgi:hypothetical protein
MTWTFDSKWMVIESTMVILLTLSWVYIPA